MKARLWLLIAALLVAATPAFATQGNCVLPTTGTVSGLTLVQDINLCTQAQMTQNSGATAPTNGAGGVTLVGQLWLRTTDNALLIYDGANFLRIGTMDTSGHIWQPPIGGGTATLASATTVDIGSTAASVITVSGTTTIAGFGSNATAGETRALVFSGVLSLTHSSSLLLPNGGQPVTTAANDRAWATYLGGGNWIVLAYQRADGTSVSTSSVFTGAVFFGAPVAATVSSNTNDWAPGGATPFLTANVVRLNCSVASNITGMVAPLSDGKLVVIDSNLTSAATCTLTSQDAASTTANRFGIDRPIAVRPGRSVIVKYDISAARWRLAQEITAQPIAGGYKNLRVFNAATALGDTAPSLPNLQMKMAADEITLEDVNGGAMRLSSLACTIDISGNSFSAGSGGLDTGTAAAPNWYYAYALYNPTTATQSCAFSLNSTPATIATPSGYTFAARVGAAYYVTNNAVTGLRRSIQYGRRQQYVITSGSNIPSVPPVTTGAFGTYSTTAPVWSTPSIATHVPPTATRITIVADNSYNSGAVSNMYVAPNSAYAGRLSTNPPPIYLNANADANLLFDMGLEGSTIAGASGGSGGFIGVLGYEDNF